MLVLSLLVLAIVLVGSAEAGIYYYVDREGVIHFTDAPTDRRFRRKRFPVGMLVDPHQERIRLDPQIVTTAQRHGLEPNLVRAVVRVESNFNSSAISSAGAQGLMQLMPETAGEVPPEQLLDPEANLEAGTRFLRGLLEEFHWNLPLALAAYNAGANAVRRHRGIPPYDQTRTFVQRVLLELRRYRAEEARPASPGMRPTPAPARRPPPRRANPLVTTDGAGTQWPRP